MGGFGGTLHKIETKIKIAHDGEVNRARICPKNSFFLATKSPNAAVYVFDYSKHPSIPTDNTCRPQHRLVGHEQEGYGLSWSPHDCGHILSGSDDAMICLWDITEGGSEVQPLQKRKGCTSNPSNISTSHVFFFSQPSFAYTYIR